MSDEDADARPRHPARGCIHHHRASEGVAPASRRGCDELATEHLILNMGPQHPSTHGVLHILLELDGEEVVAAEASLGYLHRGVEKLAESRTLPSGRHAPRPGRLRVGAPHRDGVRDGRRAARRASRCRARRRGSARSRWSSTGSRATWCGSGTFGLDAGAMAPFLYIMRDREAILDILEAITGARMMFNYVRPGGVFADLPVGIDAEDPGLPEHVPGLTSTRTTHFSAATRSSERASRVWASSTAQTALAFGMSGGVPACLGSRLRRAQGDARTAPTPRSTSTSPLGRARRLLGPLRRAGRGDAPGGAA